MKRLLWLVLLLSVCAYSQTIVFPVSTVQFSQQNAPNNPPTGKAYLYLNTGSGLLACLTPAGGDCLPTSGGGGTPGGASGTLQWNNSAAFGGVTQWTTNGTTTLTGSATAVLNLGALGITGLTLPSGAGFAPTADGKIGFNTTTHLPVWGSNGTTATLAKTLANAANKWLNSYDQTTGAFTQTQPACTNLSDAGTACAISATAGGDLSGTLPSPTVVKINGVALSGLATGILKNTTTTGVPSIAVAGDFPTLNQNTTGTASNITGVAALVNGGTGTAAASAAAAFDALSPTTTQGDLIIRGASANIRLGIGTTGLCLVSNGAGANPSWQACATGSVGAGGGLTTNAVPKASATFTLADSLLTDNATTLGYSGSGGIFLSTANAPIEFTEGTAPTGSAGHSWIYDDSTAHRLMVKNASNTGANLVVSGVDINTSDQVTVTHLASALPINQGGTATTSTLTGLVRGGNPFTASELSGDVTTSGSNAVTVTKINGTLMSGLATGILKNTTTTGVPSIAVAGDFPTLNQNTTGSAAKWTTARTLAGNSVDGSINVAFTNKFVVQGTTDAGLSGAQFLGALTTGIVKNTTTTGVLSIAVAGDFPTLNQNTTGTAAAWTTARTLAGNSVDGSLNVAFTNKFLVQGTVDAGLSGAQFMGALATGLMKNTTTTGVVSIATAADVDSLYTGAGKCYLFKGTTPGTNDGCDTPPGTLSGLGNTQVLVATGASTATSYSTFTSDTSGNLVANSYTSSDTSHAGFFGIGGGPAQAVQANTVGLTGGVAITGYNIVFPNAASSGFLKFANVANVVTGTFDAAINLTSCTDCTGVLPPANGGTGANTLTNHAPLLGAGTSAVNPMAVGGLGTTIIGQGASADPIWSATLTLGVAGTSSGTLLLANGGVGGAAITLQNNSVTSSYNWNFPTGAGTAGQCLTSGGGGSTAMTWGSCGGGTPAWDTIGPPTTSNLTLAMATHTTAFTYGDQGAAATTALFTVTDAASTSNDNSFNLVVDTGGSSNHTPFVARYRGSDALKVCPAVGSVTGTAVVGAIISCATINSVNATPIAKFLVESATSAHTTARFYQNGAAQTGNGVEIFTKTVAGTGFNSLLIKTGCTDGDTTCVAGTAQFTVRGDGLTTVNNTLSATTLTSTVSTGTAPFTVSSTTNVANLNASSLSGATFSAPGAIGGGTPSTGAFTTITGTGLTLGTDSSVDGTLTLANGSAAAHTIFGSGATTTNTIKGFAAVPTTGHLLDCTVTTTVCLLHDSGVVTANVVNASSPGVGIAHFAGSTQTVTSNLIVAADITSATITGTQIASSVALAGSPTTTTQSAKDNSTKIATTAYVDAATGLTTGTSVTLTAPRQYFVCTGTCTITMPVPAAGYEFCVLNDDNVATAITFSAIGSSAMYENTARTAYGTAGTGTLVATAVAGNKMCLLGRDSTHYLVASFNGTWTAN